MSPVSAGTSDSTPAPCSAEDGPAISSCMDDVPTAVVGAMLRVVSKSFPTRSNHTSRWSGDGAGPVAVGALGVTVGPLDGADARGVGEVPPLHATAMEPSSRPTTRIRFTRPWTSRTGEGYQ